MARAFSAAGADMISIDMLDRLDTERAEGTAYLSHEYLNAHWSPCYQIDVARGSGGGETLLQLRPPIFSRTIRTFR
jgi:hypothetical protein